MVTAPERLAKVAEVLHHEGWPAEPGWKLTPDTCGTCATTLRLALTIEPLLDEFRSEDEARDAARVREAVEAAFRALAADLWREAGRAGRRNSHTEAVNLRYAANRISVRLAAALDAAEKESAVRANLDKLDGTDSAAVSLMTGLTADDLEDLGGIDG